MTSATGTFEITSGGEATYHEAENGSRLTHASGTQRFTGDIEGEGSVEWVMCYLPDRSAVFAGMQRIDAKIAGKSGTFVLRSIGSHDGRQSKGSWSVVEGSGTGELAGIRGEGSFHAPGGPVADYDLEYGLS